MGRRGDRHLEQRMELEGGGRLEVREDGARVHLSVCRKLDSAGLYKVWLRGPRGELLLGTLTPDGRYLRLGRTMSRDALNSAGCWPITGGRAALAFAFSNQAQPGWRWERRPSLRLCDPVLREAADNFGPMLLREDRCGFLLAAPLDLQRPFPIPPLFCLGRPIQVDGRLHVVYRFAPDGTPLLPE